jgi:DNA-binding MarR family transcriptional regulator
MGMNNTVPNHTCEEVECCGGNAEPIPLAEIFQLVEIIAKKLKQIQRDTTRRANLTPAQYSILSLLQERGACPFKDLAAAHHCSPATMTGIIDAMETKGLVTREPNPDDRRSLLARLTEEGRALQDSTPDLDKIFRSCCVGLAPGEFQQLGSLLVKLNNSLPQ